MRAYLRSFGFALAFLLWFASMGALFFVGAITLSTNTPIGVGLLAAGIVLLAAGMALINTI